MSQSQIELLITLFQTGKIYILNLFILADAFKHKARKGAESNKNAGRLVVDQKQIQEALKYKNEYKLIM